MFFGLLRAIGFAWAALAMAVQPARAQQGPPEPRMLEVPVTSSWQHAATGMVLPPEAAGLRRAEVRDSTESELDVIVHYVNRDEVVLATVYLFRTQVPSAALWFDRAFQVIPLSPGWSLAGAAPAVRPFVRPGGSVASGLRTTFDVVSPQFRSTGLAVAPLGEFLLKVRISSGRLDAAGLDALLARFIADLRWPPAAAAEPAGVPIEPCGEPLRLRQARVVRDDMEDVVMNLLTGIVETDVARPPPIYCREPGPASANAVYRPGGSREAYLVALGDAGIALSVSRGLEIEGVGGNARRFSMRLLDRTETRALPSFNRLPPPEQAIAVAFGARGETISVSTRDPPER